MLISKYFTNFFFNLCWLIILKWPEYNWIFGAAVEIPLGVIYPAIDFPSPLEENKKCNFRNGNLGILLFWLGQQFALIFHRQLKMHYLVARDL